MSMKKIREYPESWLVAHRGDHADHVENTLDAFRQAADSGARFAECDIQFSRDLVPVVIHDNHLKRLCDLDLHVSMLDLVDLKELCYPYFELLTLHKLLVWLDGRPDITLFIEVKPDIRTRLSDREIAERLAKQIPETLLPQVVLISESGSILDACRTRLECRIGRVTEGNGKPASSDQSGPENQPDYIFMPYAEAACIGEWHSKNVRVGLYTINDTGLADEMCKLGADLIETDHFSRIFSELEKSRDND